MSNRQHNEGWSVGSLDLPEDKYVQRLEQQIAELTRYRDRAETLNKSQQQMIEGYLSERTLRQSELQEWHDSAKKLAEMNLQLHAQLAAANERVRVLEEDVKREPFCACIDCANYRLRLKEQP